MIPSFFIASKTSSLYLLEYGTLFTPDESIDYSLVLITSRGCKSWKAALPAKPAKNQSVSIPIFFIIMSNSEGLLYEKLKKFIQTIDQLRDFGLQSYVSLP